MTRRRPVAPKHCNPNRIRGHSDDTLPSNSPHHGGRVPYSPPLTGMDRTKGVPADTSHSSIPEARCQKHGP